MLLCTERRREVNTGSFLDRGIDGRGSRHHTDKFAGWRTYISALFCVSKSAAAGREKLEAGPQKSRRKKELNISKMCSWISFFFRSPREGVRIGAALYRSLALEVRTCTYVLRRRSWKPGGFGFWYWYLRLLPTLYAFAAAAAAAAIEITVGTDTSYRAVWTQFYIRFAKESKLVPRLRYVEMV